MRRHLCLVLSLIVVAPLLLPSSGQVVTATAGNSSSAARTPYTAEYRITVVQTLADGNTITRESTQVIAVDSQGRQMTATTAIQPSEEPPPVTRVDVFDPVARSTTMWASPGRQATVIMMPASESGHGAAGHCTAPPIDSTLRSSSTFPRQTRAMQDLGTETIQGVEAHGRLTTFTFPAGAIGNAEPLVHTMEIWTSAAPGLTGILLREKIDDPRYGTVTHELTSLTPGDPDSTLFQPPANYAVVNRAAPEISCGSLPVETLPATAPE